MDEGHCKGQWCNFCQQNPGKRLGVCWMFDGMVTAEAEESENDDDSKGKGNRDEA